MNNIEVYTMFKLNVGHFQNVNVLYCSAPKLSWGDGRDPQYVEDGTKCGEGKVRLEFSFVFQPTTCIFFKISLF
jgi:hypothetical protein